MADAQEGFRETVEGAVAGIVLSAFITVVKSISLIPPAYVFALQLFEVGNLIADIILIATMLYRGVGYLLGWWFGIGIMAYAGLVETWIVVLYIVVGLAAIVVKIWSGSRTSQYDGNF